MLFLCYGHHRDLHSFPTRRSSDLQRREQIDRLAEKADEARGLRVLAERIGQGDEEATGHRHRGTRAGLQDRKSTRLNSSHVEISYAVFCLKKKKTEE